MSPRKLISVLAVILAALGLAPGAARSVCVNRWSLRLAEVGVRERLSSAHLKRLAAELPEGHWRGRVALARVAVRAGSPQPALAWLAAAPADHPWVRKTRAEALAAQGRWREAYEAWAAAGDTKALERAANEAFAAGREQDGLAARQAWFELDPAGAAWPLAAAINRVERDAKRAAEFLVEVGSRHPEAPVATRQNWWYQAGNLFRAAREWDRAGEAYEALAAIAPYDWRSGVGRAWLVYQRDGDAGRALKFLEEAHRAASDHGEPWAQGGLILLRERRFAEAAEWFAEALAHNPNSRWWHLWHANAVREAGDLERARGLHEEVVERFPDFSQGHYELSWTYSRLDRHDEALAVRGSHPWAFERAPQDDENREVRRGS